MIRDLDNLAPRVGSAPRSRIWQEWELAALVVLVLAVYFTRLTAMPICGEESRWANTAREMIVSGDWIVPRQQGALFPERPPLGSWAIALTGLVRGEVDLVAVRLPSALATLLTTLMIYCYARTWIGRLGSLASAVCYASAAQVMQLGRFGESEAVFTLLVSASLFAWHAGYVLCWRPTVAWSLGYALAALAALAKGPQAPAYFVAACCGYLVVRRDWHWLFSRGHLAGLATFSVVIGAWLVPFAVNYSRALDDIWMGLALDRFDSDGLLGHLVSYPLETFACLLPWSPLTVALVWPSVRRGISSARPQAHFLLVAVAVTYPTVWLAAGARGRYFMPLYPCLAVLLGLIVEHCASAVATRAERGFWRRHLLGLATASLAGCVALAAAEVDAWNLWADARQGISFVTAWTAVCLVAAALLVWAALGARSPRPQVALLVTAAVVGLAWSGAALNVRIREGNELAGVLAEVKRQLPNPRELVSLGKVYHRFVYSYDAPIRQVRWPMSDEEVPADLEWFCFDRRPGDQLQDRSGDDDRLGLHTPAWLPFEWDLIAEVPCDPVQRRGAHRTVVIGRVRRNGVRLTAALNPSVLSSAKFSPLVRR